jgi:four helix bundle protein
MAYKDFTLMPVWQKALKLLVRVYQITKRFPPEEKFGMTSDMRRSANSVVHNLAEGFGRFENKDKSRFYKISRGSAYEIISQTLASYVLEYLDNDERDELLNGYKEVIDEEDLLIKSVETRKKIPNWP